MNRPPFTIALRLARRELRGGIEGFRIFLACLALGVAAIAGVQSVSSAILTGLRDNGQTLLGGDVALRSIFRPATDEQIAYLRATSDAFVCLTEMRAMARIDDGDSTLVELKGVDRNYPLFGAVKLQNNLPFAGILERRNGIWGAVVEETLLDRLSLKTGDRLLIGDADYQIRGVIEREPDRVGGGGLFGLGPRVMVDLQSLDATGLIQKGSMVYHQYRLQLPASVTPERYLEDLNAAFPTANWKARTYFDAAPRVRQTVNRLTLFLTLVGLTALLVGGVGVSNAVRAYLDGKLAAIATLKCLGAPNRTVFQTYMAQILALSGTGILLGLLIGTAAPAIAGLFLQNWLPFDIRIELYPGPLLLAAAFGLLTTLSFAVWPLARVHDIPAGALFRDVVDPRRGRVQPGYAIATAACGLLLAGLAVASADQPGFALAFVLGAAAAMLVFQAAARLVMWSAARLGRPRHPGLRLALANLYRPGAPTPNVVLSLGLGLTVLAAIALIEGNMNSQIQKSIPEHAPAFYFVDIQAEQMQPFTDLVGSLEGTGALHEVPYLRGRIEKVNGVPAEQALVNDEHEWMIRGDRGLTYSTTAPDNTNIIAGQWWPQDYAGPPLLSIHKDVTEAFGIGLGDTITVNVLGRDITATVANVRDLDWRSLQINFALMMSPEPLRHAPHTFIATLEASPQAELAIKRAVTQHFPNVTTVRIKEALDAVNGILRDIATAVRSIAAITLIAGALVLAGAIAAGHRRRVYDSVVLKVLGATRGEVLRAFLFEYGLLGLITALIAAAVGTLISWAVMTQVMETNWRFIPAAVLATTLLCTGITLALGFAGTWRALGQKAAPLLRNE